MHQVSKREDCLEGVIFRERERERDIGVFESIKKQTHKATTKGE